VTGIELDCRGLRCPRPVIELGKAFGRLEVGQTVTIVTEDPAARGDVEAWCRMRGQEYVGSGTAADGVPTYLVRRVS
jgi:TusA-related sulfurtransferase